VLVHRMQWPTKWKATSETVAELLSKVPMFEETKARRVYVSTQQFSPRGRTLVMEQEFESMADCEAAWARFWEWAGQPDCDFWEGWRDLVAWTEPYHSEFWEQCLTR